MIVTLFPGFCIDLVELFNSHSVYPFLLYCTMLQFVTMTSLNEDTYMHALLFIVISNYFLQMKDPLTMVKMIRIIVYEHFKLYFFLHF